MIREFKDKDLDVVMQLWLNTNIQAHNFLKDYWLKNYELVKSVLPQAEVYVYQNSDKIEAFIGLNDNYIQGIFVEKSAQSKGIGKKLLNYVKEKHSKLILSVYKKNTGAISFYQREGFIIQKENINDATFEEELILEWKK